MSRFLTVLLKECLDGLRDRRSLASAMLVPLLLPLMSTGLLVMMLSKDEADLGKDGGDPDVLVTGMEHAPGLIAWLDDHGLDPVPYDLAMLPEGFVRQVGVGLPLFLIVANDGTHGLMVVA